ncbi:MAG: SpoIIE family protein phosphatase [Leptospiraceae bacterium]|nr:SpoIIE family protein phosphatase [Leptospiraceae bacterium]
MNFFRKSIVLQFVAPAILSILTTATVTGFMSFQAANHAVKEKLKLSDLQKIVELKAEKIDGRLKRAKETSLSLARDPSLISWFSDAERDKKLGKLVLEKITELSNHYDYSTVSAINELTYHYWIKDNKLLSTISRDEPHDAWFFRFMASGQEVEFNIDYNKDLESTFIFTNALIGTKDSPIGSAGVGIDLTQSAKEFSEIDSFKGRSWLVDEKGIIKIAKNKEEIGTDSQTLFPQIVRNKIFDENDDSPVVLEGVSSSNKEVYYAIAKLKEERWFVVYEVSIAMVTKPLITIRLITITSAILSTVFAILIFSFISRRISRPIQHLTEISNRIAEEGDLNIEINISSRNEIGRLAKSFNIMTKNLRELYSSLEQKVKDRTRELQETLNEVQLLKERQDGDYFLTKLIIQPLTYNHAGDTNVHVSYLVDQKKKFSFKNKHHEIGGDICIADEIELNHIRYTVYINADAMGKSIQGAGGVIALGVVFKSIISRTKSLESKNLFPEKWLKSAFIELQTVFESFDGSMMISLVLGLIDNNNGFNYYINAEHPWPVLYRDGIASFIGSEDIMYKVGTMDQESRFHIKTIQMEAGDVLLIGSDGKDDIKIKNKEGIVELNYDENLFLDFVKKGDGDLTKIRDLIYNSSEITDDFSLLKLEYNPAPKKRPHFPIKEYLSLAKEQLQNSDIEGSMKSLEMAYRVDPEHPNVLRSLINVNRKLKKFEDSAFYCEKMIHLDPSNTDLILECANSHFKSENPERAIDYLERIRLRNPKSLPTLLLYSEILIYQKNYKRASKIIKQLIGVDPDNEKAREYYKLIEEEIGFFETEIP